MPPTVRLRLRFLYGQIHRIPLDEGIGYPQVCSREDGLNEIQYMHSALLSWGPKMGRDVCQ